MSRGISMSEQLCVLSTGDKVYFYDKSIVVYFNGKRKILSTSLYNGGYHDDYIGVYNYDAKQGAGMPCEMLADTYVEHMQLISERLALDPYKVSGMGTAASMENAVIESMSFKELTVTAIVTGGIETNGGRVGDPADYYKPVPKSVKYGTINIILMLDCDLSEGVMARALVTCTEAKTAAIQELLEGSKYSNGIATGSGTDQTIIVVNSESDLYLDGAGKHSKLGELIGRVVKAAVKKALAKQSGLTPEKQHDVFRRIKRFGINSGIMWQEYSVQGCSAVKPEYLVAAETLAKENEMLTYTSLFIHLLDQYFWKLISAEEMQDAGQQLLKFLAEFYDTESEIIIQAEPDYMLKSWKVLFNKIVDKRLQAENELE